MTLLDDAGSWTARAEADPLGRFKFMNPRLIPATKALGRATVYVHAANGAGKTTWGAAVAVTLLRRMVALAGIDMPPMPKQVVGILVVPSYKQSMGSSIQMVMQMIGSHPHEIVRAGPFVSAIRVKQRGNLSDDTNTWSVLYVFPHDGEVPKGIRADFVWADEPLPIKLLHELLSRSRAGREFVAYITATPLGRLDSPEGPGWQPLLDYFRDCLGKIVNGRLRVQTSIYDNEALTLKDLIAAEQRRGVDRDADDPYANAIPSAKARLLGEHTDDTGACPFSEQVLSRWLDMARDPDQVAVFTVQAEGETTSGKHIEAMECRYEAWGDVDASDLYLLVLDPARGKDPNAPPNVIRDPDGLHVWSRRKRALVGRVNQYLGGWGLGMAAVEIAKTYNDAQICVARGGGYGETVLSAIRQARYHRLVSTVKDAATTGTISQLGFTETHESRGRAIGALQQALVTGDADIPSRDVIQCLKDCIIDAKGKIVAGPRGHDEDLICAGIALSIIQTRANTLPRVTEHREPSSAEQFRDTVNRTFGRKVFPRNGAFMGHRDSDGIWG